MAFEMSVVVDMDRLYPLIRHRNDLLHLRRRLLTERESLQARNIQRLHTSGAHLSIICLALMLTQWMSRQRFHRFAAFKVNSRKSISLLLDTLYRCLASPSASTVNAALLGFLIIRGVYV